MDEGREVSGAGYLGGGGRAGNCACTRRPAGAAEDTLVPTELARRRAGSASADAACSHASTAGCTGPEGCGKPKESPETPAGYQWESGVWMLAQVSFRGYATETTLEVLRRSALERVTDDADDLRGCDTTDTTLEVLVSLFEMGSTTTGRGDMDTWPAAHPVMTDLFSKVTVAALLTRLASAVTLPATDIATQAPLSELQVACTA
mmetsp:Transcript_51943/g.166305  ORF Transcript_51943/g.166305 Transcript_51943/m.166305 type:complete len:205 (+) Transcript_51943:1127-1741(+)